MRINLETTAFVLILLLLLTISSDSVLAFAPPRNARPRAKIRSYTARYALPRRFEERFDPSERHANISLSRARFLAAATASAMSIMPEKASAQTPPSPINTKSLPALQESISGFVAGAALTCTKTLAKYPLDTITVRLQMKNTGYTLLNLPQLFEGSYRGVAPPLLANIPAGAVFFAVKDATKTALGGSGLSRLTKTSISVAVAQIPYWIVRNPSEVVKTRQQANIAGYGAGVGALKAYQQVLSDTRRSKDGIGTGFEGFYIGYWENILYAYPADVIKFIIYDILSGRRKSLPPAEGAIAGAVATAVAQFVTTPLDVVRNRAMAQDRRSMKNAMASPASYTDSLFSLAHEEGLRGLFAGASPRIGKAVLSGAIQFATYEEIKQRFAKLFQRQQ